MMPVRRMTRSRATNHPYSYPQLGLPCYVRVSRLPPVPDRDTGLNVHDMKGDISLAGTALSLSDVGMVGSSDGMVPVAGVCGVTDLATCSTFTSEGRSAWSPRTPPTGSTIWRAPPT